MATKGDQPLPEEVVLPRPGPEPPRQTASRKNGLLLMADIVAFSEKPEKEQERSLRYLLEENRKLVQVYPESSYWVSPTGDGFLLAADPDGIPPGAFLDLATQLHAACAAYKPLPTTPVRAANLAVRIGIHSGTFFVTDILDRPYPVGSGPNECRRVGDIGDGRTTVCSQEFVDAYTSLLGIPEETGCLFVPDLNDTPFEVPVKHRRTVRVRVVIGPKGGVQPQDAQLPEKLRQVQIVESALNIRGLQSVEEAIVHFLGKASHGGLTSEDLSTRVSILVPSTDGKCLTVTRFRHHRRNEFIAPSKTKYGLVGDVQGLPGRAFVADTPQVIVGLPDYRKDRKGYGAAFRKWNISPVEIDGWQRKSRAFLAVAFGLTVPRAGVVCVDWENPLRSVGARRLFRIAQHIQEEYMPELGALWALRG